MVEHTPVVGPWAAAPAARDNREAALWKRILGTGCDVGRRGESEGRGDCDGRLGIGGGCAGQIGRDDERANGESLPGVGSRACDARSVGFGERADLRWASGWGAGTMHEGVDQILYNPTQVLRREEGKRSMTEGGAGRGLPLGKRSGQRKHRTGGEAK